MKRNFFQAGAMVSLLCATVSAPTLALAGYRCDDPSATIEKRACAKAAEGNEALRRFVSRTRGIWNLYYYDYAQPGPPRASNAAATAQHAPAGAQAGRVAVAGKSR
jgi:hypothetical protein